VTRGERPSRTEKANSSRVYVGNLSFGVSWQDLKDHMRKVGNVVRADVLTNPAGRSRGGGVVEYETVEQANASIDTLNDTELDGRKIFVRPDREDKGFGRT